MKTNLLKILQMTPEIYDDLVFQQYLQWCLLNSLGTDKDLQKLLANTALFNWWQAQYRHLEEIFLEDSKHYQENCHKRVIRAFYAEITIDIARYYPKALIKAARNQTPLTPQLN